MSFKEELIEFRKNIIENDISKYLTEKDKETIKWLIKEEVRKELEANKRDPDTVFLKVDSILKHKRSDNKEQVFLAIRKYINSILELKTISTSYNQALIVIDLEDSEC